MDVDVVSVFMVDGIADVLCVRGCMVCVGVHAVSQVVWLRGDKMH